MTLHLGMLWDRVRTGYWFLPSLMAVAVAAAALAMVMVAVDDAVGDREIAWLVWTYSGGPDGARQTLATLAGSMITVAGVTFSITAVALTLASQQYGPRQLRSFLRDTGQQVPLGTFIATFVYCLLVLRTIRGAENGNFVPNLSVSVGVALGMASLFVLIYFIHHVSTSIGASSVVAAVGHELEHSVDRLFPQELGEGAGDDGAGQEPDEQHDDRWWTGARPVPAPHSGYLESVDADALMAVLAAVAGAARRATDRETVRRHGQLTLEAGADLPEAGDRAALEQAHARLRAALSPPPG